MQGCNSSRRAGGRGWAGTQRDTHTALPPASWSCHIPVLFSCGFFRMDGCFAARQTLLSYRVVLSIHFDTEITAPEHPGCHQR